MGYLKDKILSGGEITSQGEFTKDKECFYIMLVPKTESSASVGVLSVQLSDSSKLIDFPFTAGTWNPVVCTKVNVKQQDLDNYRIFYGME